MFKHVLMNFLLVFYFKEGFSLNLCLSHGCYCDVTEMTIDRDKSKSNFTVNCQSKNMTRVPKVELKVLGSKPTTINFSKNFLLSLEDNIFSSQTDLKMVVLRFNKIEHISIAAFNISQVGEKPFVSPIEYIDLRDNDFYSFPACFGRINRTVASLDNLKTLLLGGNWLGSDITMLSFSGVRNLKKLDLSRCLISNVPNLWFKKLNHLEELDLSRNNIHWISDTVFARNTPLKTLRLDFNQLISIPNNLPKPLQELYFSSNNLDGSRQQCFNGLKRLEKLLYLDLSLNNLCCLYSNSFDRLGNLRYLNLSHNSLSSIKNDSFKGLRNLKVLCLNNNQNLLRVPDLANLTCLQYIFAQDCQLKTLIVNGSEVVESKINNGSDLKSVWLFGNPLACDCFILPLVKFLKKNHVKLDASIQENESGFSGIIKTQLSRIRRPRGIESMCTRPINRHNRVVGIPLLNVTESHLFCPDDFQHMFIACFLGLIAFMGVIPLVMMLIQIYLTFLNFFVNHCGYEKEKEE